MAQTKANPYHLDFLFLRRLFLILKVLFPSWCCATVLLFVFVLIVSVLDQVVSYFVGLIASEAYVAFGQRDFDKFNLFAWKSLGIVVGKSVTLSTVKYATSILYLNWRRLLCDRLHSLYFEQKSFYSINLKQTDIDNVDQRITQDVEKTCSSLQQIFAPLIIAPFIIAYYTYQTYMGAGYIGPVSIYVYFIVTTIITKFAMNPIVDLVVRQEKGEGDFRFKHMAVRSNAEAISFYHGTPLEKHLTNRKLETLLSVQRVQFNWRFLLNIWNNLVDYFGAILSYFIMAVPIFGLHWYEDKSGVELTGIVSKSSFLFMYLINAFTNVIDLSNKFTDMAGTVHRIAQLITALESTSPTKPERKPHREEPLCNGSVAVEIESGNEDTKEILESSEETVNGSVIPQKTDEIFLSKVCYTAPNSEHLLVRNLSFEINEGTNILITGGSSSGKTALFRILSGLWERQSGDASLLDTRKAREVLFLPQKPYFTNGSIRQQIVYPMDSMYSVQKPEDTDIILEILRIVRMEPLLERLESVDEMTDWTWQDVLSPGEMQRLSFARVLYHRPQFAFLDEATSALDSRMEAKLYLELKRLQITCVSIGHRETLRKFHEIEVKLDGNGGWELAPIGPQSNLSLTSNSYQSLADRF